MRQRRIWCIYNGGAVEVGPCYFLLEVWASVDKFEVMDSTVPICLNHASLPNHYEDDLVVEDDLCGSTYARSRRLHPFGLLVRPKWGRIIYITEPPSLLSAAVCTTLRTCELDLPSFAVVCRARRYKSLVVYSRSPQPFYLTAETF